MSNISTFGTFTMARLGIYAAHKAIDITGNNISNINTEGYTRQNIDQFSMNMGGADRYQSLMDTRIGSGAFVTGVHQTRDQFLDIRYRNELASVGAMEAKQNGLSQIAGILDEVGKGEDGEGNLEARFEELVQMLQKLNTEGPGRDDYDTLVRSTASSLVDTFHALASELETTAENLAKTFDTEVENINSILVRIRDLNASIRKTQVYGGNALEAQDERNVLIDELAEYFKLNVTYEREIMGEGLEVDKLVLTTGDEPPRTLVDGIYATQLSVRQVEAEDGTLVRDPRLGIDLGPLKDSYARILAAEDDGGPVAVSSGTVYTVTAGESSYATKAEADAMAEALTGDTDAAAGPGGEENYYTYRSVELTDGEGAVTGYGLVREHTDGGATESATVHVETAEALKAAPAEDDATAYATKEEAEAAAEALNENAKSAVSDNGQIIDTEYQVKKEGEFYFLHQVAVNKGAAHLNDTELYGRFQSLREILTEQGVFSTAEELAEDPNAASKRGIPFYQKALDVLANQVAYLVNDANITAGGEALFSNNGAADTYGVSGSADDPPITASNIAISKSWANRSRRVITSTDEDQSTGNDAIRRLLNLFTGKQQFTAQGGNAAGQGAINTDAASTEVFFTGTFQELLTGHIAGGLATDQNVTQTMLNNYRTEADELYVNRDGVMGVDLNDEAMNLMMYQKSYAAACRLMTAYDQMLDKLINGTAV